MGEQLTSASFPNGIGELRSEQEVRCARLSMVDVINRGAGAVAPATDDQLLRQAVLNAAEFFYPNQSAIIPNCYLKTLMRRRDQHGPEWGDWFDRQVRDEYRNLVTLDGMTS